MREYVTKNGIKVRYILGVRQVWEPNTKRWMSSKWQNPKRNVILGERG